MLRGKLRKTLAGALSLSMAFGTALSSVGVMPVLAEEALPDPAIIPQPLEYEAGEGAYTLRRCARIVVQGKDAEDEQSLLNTADLLAARFRKSTGYDLPVVVNGNAAGDIILKTSDASPELEDEGYTLTTSPEGVVIEAYEPAGVYNGTQTLRQMFPAEIEKQEVAEGVKWVAKAAEITDKPEYSYRGMHLDVSRHFFTVEQVKRQIDLISQFKINKLHMHLSDDQGWRLEIKGEMYGESLDKLRTIGASTSCSTNGYKPGMYTQEDFKELVRYAAERNVEIIPEFDMPAHAWAALVSLEFLNSTEDGKPHAGNYDNTKPYDGWDVGWASLETKNEKTYEFIEEVVKQVSAISPSPIIHLGGDEAHSTARADYAEFMNRVIQIGAKYGKKVMGWQNMDQVLSEENKNDAIVQFWSTGNAKMMDGIDYILTPADHAYMDMKYDSDCEFGLTWATMNPVDDSYNWEPTNYGKREHILGVECALWTETIADDYALDYMIYPRVAGHAEVGWTAPNSREWNEYKGRIAQYYDRFIYEGISLRKDEIIWPTPYVPVNSSFSFEEGEGTVVADNEGNWTGTISGNPSFVDGVKGKAVHFDGATCIDLDYGKDLQGAWTASMWVNREASTGTNAVILSGKEGEIKLDQWKNTGKVGLTKFGVKDASFNYEAPLNEWVYLTFVCDESKTDLYVNGQFQDSTNLAIKGPFSRIGHCAKSDMESTGFMNGSVDELAVYNEALTPEQIAALYAQFGNVSKDNLERIIKEAEALNETDYTASTWAVLAGALTAARDVYANEEATDEEIIAAISALRSAIDGLEKAVPENQIRIASYNIAANKHPDQAAMNKQLAAAGVTIAGLQEVDVNTGRNSYDMLERFASYGNYPHTQFQKSIDYSGGQYGNGVISSLEIKEGKGGPLISEGIDEARSWMRAVVEKDGHELVLYNTHLTHENRAARSAQMHELLEIVKNDPAEYIAITGDFNTEDGKEEWLEAMKDFNLSNGHNGVWLNSFNGTTNTAESSAAIDNIVVTRNLKILDVYMVENKLSDHNMLVGTFEFLDAPETSFDYLNEILEQAKALDSEDWTEESYADLAEAIAAAEALGEDATQEEVDAAAAALEEAIAALEERPVTPVEKLYINDSETGTGLHQFNFVGQWKTSVNYPDLFYNGDEHWVNFSSFTGEEMPYYTITFEGTGIEIYGNHEATAGIYEVTVDDGEMTEADAYAPSRQTQSLLYSVRDLPYGTHTIKVLATDRKNEAATAHNIEVDFAIVYNEKKDEPVKPGTDTSRIKALLKEAMLYAETVMNSDDFAKLAPAVQTLLTMRYEEAEVVYNDADATFDEVAEAWKNLTDAIHMAAFYADKTDLKNKIDEADALDLSGYTEESAAALREALENAKAVYEDDTALQERIDQALADLIAAMAGLTEQPSNVDKSMLKMLLDEAGIAYGDPDSYVQDEAWNAFVAAYDAAQAVYDDETADADAVAAAVTSLGSAYLGIRHVPDEDLVKALREFAALAETITRELYTEDVLEEIDAIVYEINTMLMADHFDNAYAAKFVEETVQPMADFIRETENSQKPVTPDTPATGEPSVKPGTDKDPAEEVKKPAADTPVSDSKSPADAAGTDKAASTAKSVKTAAGLGAAGWMMAAAGAAAVAALNRSRKNR